MKSIKLIAITLLVAAATVATPSAQAQFRWGVKGGINVNSLHLNTSTFDDANRTGWTAGVMAEFTMPVVGVGFDMSAMFVRRTGHLSGYDESISANRSYIEIPLNLKYKVNIPVINSIIRPYLTTGPSVSVLTSRHTVGDLYHNRGLDWAWNFGLGVELIKHLQVGASYGLGINNAMRFIGTDAQPIAAKNRSWTITAAYLF